MVNLQADNLTVLLLAGCIGLFFCHLFFLRPGSSTAHPILLGRQGESEKVRIKGESAVWTNALATSGMLVASSQSSIKGIKNIVDLKKTPECMALARKLKKALPGITKETPGAVAILLSDERETANLISACVLIEGLSLVLIQPILHQHASTLLSEVGKLHAIISSTQIFHSLTIPPSVSLLLSVDTLFATARVQGLVLQELIADDDVVLHNFAVEPRSVIIQAAVQPPSGGPTLIDLTNQSLTAAAHAVVNLLSSSSIYKLGSKDITLSAYSVSSPFGLSLHLGAISVDSKITFSVFKSSKELLHALKTVRPTLLFLPATQATSLLAQLSSEFSAKGSTFWRSHIWASKLHALRSGQVSRSHTLWDSSFFPLSGLRQNNILNSLRAVLVFAHTPSEVLTQAQIDALRVFIGVPVVQGSQHWMSPSPLTASLLHDFQALSADANDKAHVGPPVNNLQVKLLLDKDVEEEGSEMEMVGELLVDGPGIVRPGGKAAKAFGGMFVGDAGWLKTGWRAAIMPNGTIRLQ